MGVKVDHIDYYVVGGVKPRTGVLFAQRAPTKGKYVIITEIFHSWIQFVFQFKWSKVKT